MTTQVARLQQRTDTSTNWSTVNPVLLAGEYGYETDTKRRKLGDGSTAWNSLPYASPNFYIATSQPSGIATGDFWLDSSTAI